MYMGCGLDSALGSISSDTYPNAPDRETQLITQFVNSIADISTNDLTVHYIGHTQFLADQPYLDLTHTVLNTSKYIIYIYIYRYIYIYILDNLSEAS